MEEKKLIKGTHHVALKCTGVENYNETVRFYHEILGMDIIRSWGEGPESGMMLNTGNSIIELFADGNTQTKTGSINHYALATDDVDACAAAVRAAGYQITVEPADITINSVPAFPIRMAFCVGPVGEEIEFFTEL